MNKKIIKRIYNVVIILCFIAVSYTHLTLPTIA